jgi:hypothetical protein
VRKSVTATVIGSGIFFTAREEEGGLARGHRCRRSFEATRTPRGRSDLISHFADRRWSPRRRTLANGAGASALAEGSNPAPPDSGLSLDQPGGVNESEAGSKEELSRPTAALPRPAGTAPRTGHRLRLPRPRVSPAFFASLRVHTMGHSAAVPRRSRRPSIAGRVHVLAQSSTGSKTPGARCN